MSLTNTTLGGNIIHNVQLRSYFAATTGPDPERIFAGSNLTNYLNLNASVVTTDLLGTPTVNYLEANPGQYLGFSFRETDPTGCPQYACNSLKTIGSHGRSRLLHSSGAHDQLGRSSAATAAIISS